MKIKGKQYCAVAAVALLGALGMNASASTVALTQGSYQNGIGGEFQANVSDNSLDTYIGGYSSLTGNASANTFQTFCLEYNEEFYYGQNYNYQVSGAAIHGGTPTQDTVSVGTAWLYSQFAKGTLATTTYGSYFSGTATRQVQAGLLQNAIWWLEGEITTSQASNPFILAATVALTGIGSTSPNGSPSQGGTGLAADSFGLLTAASFGVSVLNLGPFDGNPNVTSQDQLIYQAVGLQEVPDGGTTLSLLGLALTGLGALKYRMRKAV